MPSWAVVEIKWVHGYKILRKRSQQGKHDAHFSQHDVTLKNLSTWDLWWVNAVTKESAVPEIASGMPGIASQSSLISWGNVKVLTLTLGCICVYVCCVWRWRAGERSMRTSGLLNSKTLFFFHFLLMTRSLWKPSKKKKKTSLVKTKAAN